MVLEMLPDALDPAVYTAMSILELPQYRKSITLSFLTLSYCKNCFVHKNEINSYTTLLESSPSISFIPLFKLKRLRQNKLICQQLCWPHNNYVAIPYTDITHRRNGTLISSSTEIWFMMIQLPHLWTRRQYTAQDSWEGGYSRSICLQRLLWKVPDSFYLPK